MPSNLFTLARFTLHACLLACLLLCVTGCGTVTALWGPTTTVAPIAGEDLKKPCKYEMQFPARGVSQKGVFVVFDRGDSMDLYTDPAIQAMAAQLQFATMYAYECDAASFDDLQPQATKGPGRALFQALTQFSTLTQHPELANANVVLFGFSAGGFLSMTMANAYPDRVLAAIPYAPASGMYNLDDMAVTGGAKVPVLILASSGDWAAGTERPLSLFQRGWAVGAPWAFAVQKDVAHCCTDSTQSLLIPWVNAVIAGQTSVSAAGESVLQAETGPAASAVQFECTPNGYFDSIGWPRCDFSSASILPSTAGGPEPSWMPSAAVAQAWLRWVTSPGGNRN